MYNTVYNMFPLQSESKSAAETEHHEQQAEKTEQHAASRVEKRSVTMKNTQVKHLVSAANTVNLNCCSVYAIDK